MDTLARGILDSSFSYIEGNTFSATTGVASGFDTVTKVIEADVTASNLMRLAFESDSVKDEIIVRIFDLENRPTDKQYANPYDFALVTYLWILQKTDPKGVELVAYKFCHNDDFFWTQILARHIEYGLPLIIGA